MLGRGLLGKYDWAVKYVGIPLQFLGITSIAEGYFEWQDFFGNLLQHYEDARSYLFSLSHIHVSPNVQNYAVVGLGLATTVFKIMTPLSKIARTNSGAKRSASVALLDFAIFLILFLLWPLAILMMAYTYYLYRWSDGQLKSNTGPAEMSTRRSRKEKNQMHQLRSSSRSQLFLFAVNYIALAVLLLVSIFLYSDFTG